MNQIQMRYSQCPELVKRVLSLMDFEKINYDLIEAVIEYILEGPDFPKKGSILVFLPGLQEIMTLYDQICKNPRYVLLYITVWGIKPDKIVQITLFLLKILKSTQRSEKKISKSLILPFQW